jgi:hypothetical protein
LAGFEPETELEDMSEICLVELDRVEILAERLQKEHHNYNEDGSIYLYKIHDAIYLRRSGCYPQHLCSRPNFLEADPAYWEKE